MNEIIPIPQTPQDAFDSLAGQRPDLFLTATRTILTSGVADVSPCVRAQFAIYSDGAAVPHLQFIGGCN